jgi:hypothetical protein
MKTQHSAILLICFFVVSCTSGPNKTQEEAEWQSLFNGKDLSGWIPKIMGHPTGENYNNTFVARDGVLSVNYSKYEEFNNSFGHIFYEKPFSNYVLRLEYRFVGEQVAGGEEWAWKNSGVMIHSQSPESMLINQNFPISLEVQLLGGGLTDERPTANLCTPGTHVDMHGELVTDHCISSSSKTFRGEEWISLEIHVDGHDKIKHVVNGDTVMVYEHPQIGGGVVSNYSEEIKNDGAPLHEGYISLQSESHPIEFRHIEILNLGK